MKIKKLLIVLSLLSTVIDVNAQPATEKMFKEMILNLPNYKSKPGTNFTLVFSQFSISKPVKWTMEYGNNPSQDKNTKVYKVIADFTLTQETYNTQSGKKYSTDIKKHRRPYNFYIDRSGNWVCVPVGLSSGYY